MARYDQITFLGAVILVLATLTPSLSAQAQFAPIQTHTLPGGVYWIEGGVGSNAGVVIGKDGVIVIDAKQTQDSGRAVIAEVAKLTPKPITHVILTHSNLDHVDGLVAFPKGLTIISQEN
jgi:cyclase